MQINLELTNLINECLNHPVNKDFKGNFETFTSILFSGDPESDDKIYTREEFLGLKPDTNIVHMLYDDKIDFHWDEDTFFYNVVLWDNKDVLDIMLSHGFELNEKCIKDYHLEDRHLTTSNKCTEIIEKLALNYKLQSELLDSPFPSRGMKI